MDDLLAWLTACLDETERVAREATDGPWRWRREDRLRLETSDGQWEYDAFDATHDWWPDATVIESSGFEEHDLVIKTADAAHIARNDPRSVLACVEAGRVIVRAHTPGLVGGREMACAVCHREGNEPGLCDTLRWLAYGHRYDYPGWQDSWTPDSAAHPPR